MTDHPQTREGWKALMREAIHEEFELIGISAGDADDRQLIRDDMRFIRRLRQSMNGLATKVGYTVIAGVVMFFGSLLMLGFQARYGK